MTPFVNILMPCYTASMYDRRWIRVYNNFACHTLANTCERQGCLMKALERKYMKSTASMKGKDLICLGLPLLCLCNVCTPGQHNYFSISCFLDCCPSSSFNSASASAFRTFEAATLLSRQRSSACMEEICVRSSLILSSSF